MISLTPLVKAAENSKQKKKPKPVLFEELARHICHEGAETMATFPCELHVVEHVRGEPIIYEESHGQTLNRRSLDFVAEQILKFARTMVTPGRFVFDSRDAFNAAKFWFMYAPRLESAILPVVQKTEIGYNFHRLPWDFAAGYSPHWDEMFERLQNAEAIMAWIGSLFVAHSERQQYVWIYGEGGNGKGAINRFLKRVFNGAYKSESVPERGDKFWTSNLLNSRVVVFPDCNNYNFPTTGLFKQITGDDPIKVEFKGENAFSADLVCKLLFLSNRRPNISGQTSDTRRAIFGEIGAIVGDPIPTKMYDALLWDEAPQFLYKCVKTYNKLCPDDGYIPTDKAITEDLVSDNEEYYESLFGKKFEVEPLSERNKLQNSRAYVAPQRMQDLLSDLKMSEFDKRSFLEFIKRRYGVRKVAVTITMPSADAAAVRKVEKRYIGIRELGSSALASFAPGSFIKYRQPSAKDLADD